MKKINITFKKVWIARLISILGTGLTEFGLSVWVFETTGKATPMAITILFSILPSIILAPLSGMLCDQFNRKHIIIIIIADTIAGLISLSLLLYLSKGEFNLWVICFFIFISSFSNNFDNNAYQASISTLVGSDELKKATGMNQLIDSLNNIFAPVIAGILYYIIGLKGIIILDLLSYIVSMFIFLGVNKSNFSDPQLLSKQKGGFKQTWIGFKFIFSQYSLLLLLIYFTILNFLFNISSALIEPLSLVMGSSITLGIVKACGGIGLLCGSLYVTFHNSNLKSSKIIRLASLGAGIALILMGSTTLTVAVAIGRFLFSCSGPIASTIAATLWLTRTPKELQGRVFAARMMLTKLFMPIAYIIVGPLVDYVIPEWLNGGNGSFIIRILGTYAIEYRLVFVFVGMAVIFLTGFVTFSRFFKELDS